MKKIVENHVATFVSTIFTMLIVTYISGFVAFAFGVTLYWMSYGLYGFIWIPYVGSWMIANSGWFFRTIVPVVINFCIGYFCIFLSIKMVKTKNKNANVLIILLAALLTYIVYGYFMHSAMRFYSRLFGCLTCIEVVLLFIYFRLTNKIAVPQPQAMNTLSTPPPPPPANHG